MTLFLGPIDIPEYPTCLTFLNYFILLTIHSVNFHLEMFLSQCCGDITYGGLPPGPPDISHGLMASRSVFPKQFFSWDKNLQAHLPTSLVRCLKGINIFNIPKMERFIFPTILSRLLCPLAFPQMPDPKSGFHCYLLCNPNLLNVF